MTWTGALLGFVSVAVFACWMLVGGDEGTPGAEGDSRTAASKM